MLVELVVALTVCITGTLSQYDQGPTDQTLINRTTPGRTAHTLPANWREVEGYIASPHCADIGQVWSVTWRTHTARLMVFDCAGNRSGRAWMRRNTILGEIDYYLARLWHAQPRRGLTDAVVCKAE